MSLLWVSSGSSVMLALASSTGTTEIVVSGVSKGTPWELHDKRRRSHSSSLYPSPLLSKEETLKRTGTRCESTFPPGELNSNAAVTLTHVALSAWSVKVSMCDLLLNFTFKVVVCHFLGSCCENQTPIINEGSPLPRVSTILVFGDAKIYASGCQRNKWDHNQELEMALKHKCRDNFSSYSLCTKKGPRPTRLKLRGDQEGQPKRSSYKSLTTESC